MYRVITCATTDEATNKLSDKIYDFITTQRKFAKEHSFLLDEIGVKSFTRTIDGHVYTFKLQKGVLSVYCEGTKVCSFDFNQGYSNKDTYKIASKVMKFANN